MKLADQAQRPISWVRIMKNYLKRFLFDAHGAITVDLIVLTAAVVGLMIAALSVFLDGVTAHADLTTRTIAERPVGSGF